MESYLADTVAIAYLVKRSPSTVRGWANRGQLKRRGTDQRGRTLYDLREARELATRLTR